MQRIQIKRFFWNAAKRDRRGLEGKKAAAFKKAAQNFFLCWAMGVVPDNAQGPD
ncbi:hypothetical protein [Acidocella sp.]|uniref:hypothetical protein n=1 Tax=Acidocella sp. TaxID=50710 RepID=UPI002F41EDF3